MHISLSYLLLIAAFSFVTGLVLIPMIRKVALHFNLVDKPNYRKVHSVPTPLVGGIALVVVVFLNVLLTKNSALIVQEYLPLLGSGFILLIIGVIDDKNDISAKLKLAVQLLLSVVIAHSGIRITNLYGFFGINELNLIVQYVLTIVIITGVVNAFNLMDGVDGLVGSLTLLGFSLMLFGSWIYGNPAMMVLSGIFIGALISFLRFNFSSKQKIFMGDSGSLFLGFILVTFGIKILQLAAVPSNPHFSVTLLLIIAFFAIPVFDSMRVYVGRLKRGRSPFKADKTHLHHVLLSLGLSHKKIALSVVFMCALLLLLGFFLIENISQTLIILSLFIVFYGIMKVLLMFSSLFFWRLRIKELEQQS